MVEYWNIGIFFLSPKYPNKYNLGSHEISAFAISHLAKNIDSPNNPGTNILPIGWLLQLGILFMVRHLPSTIKKYITIS